MFIFINAFLIGIASGLRALIGLAAVSSAAHFGILPLSHTWLAFLGYTLTPYVLTLMAIGELVNDKLPKTPSRLIRSTNQTPLLTSAWQHCQLAFLGVRSIRNPRVDDCLYQTGKGTRAKSAVRFSYLTALFFLFGHEPLSRDLVFRTIRRGSSILPGTSILKGGCRLPQR